MATSRPAEFDPLCRILLGFLRPQFDLHDCASLTEPEWEALARLALEQRLAPLIHSEWHGEDRASIVPDRIQSLFAESHRQQGMIALAQRSDLLLASRLLAEAGIACVALKGAMLAWHAYPAAALRPLRDLDLLVAKDEAVRAWEVLHAAGFSAPEGLPGKSRAQTAKHLPPLLAPHGSEIELHLRCWEDCDAAGRAMPRAQDRRIMEAALNYAEDDPTRYPAPDDMLMHLAIHATAPYPLDAGPLVLSDLDFLVRRYPLDWDCLWRKAATEFWSRHAAYAIALTDRWRRPGLLQESRCPQPVPKALLDAAPALLFQPWAERAATQFQAMLKQPSVAIFRKAGKLFRKDGLRWLSSRLTRTLGDAQNPAILFRAKSMSAVSHWINA